ncbi:MAG: RIP metalloprotease RseP [Verrucomicrobia bacterium]|nr:MAG: RIP metalloprotease RseP [Verrucomicrobiota bacterium]
MQVLKIILICAEVVMLFNLLIIVHELGHYLAARWRGLVVERFGIWFGKPIWKKKINGVDFCLGCIPAGGYVALPQMAPMEAIEGKNEAERQNLPPVSVLDKIIVAFAGPLFSFTLALVFAGAVWIIGRPVSEKETATTIGYVHKDSPAEKVGLLPGDKILEVDGHRIVRFAGVGDSVTWRVWSSEGEAIRIKVERGGKILEFAPVPIIQKTKAWERKGLRQIGIEPAFTPMIGEVVHGSPAERAGLKPNDFILAVNGAKLIHAADLGEYIEKHPNETLSLKRQRGNQIDEVTLKPEIPVVGELVPRIGVKWDDTGKMSLVYPAPFEQIRLSVDAMVGTFGALLSSKSDIKAQHLTGPLGILRIYYILFESDQGWRMAIWFSVLLNVNLALINLLPIPVLDGGHILLALIEAVRRKPINVRILNWIQSACAVLVIGYILYLSFYDAQDFPWRQSKQDKPTEIKFAPKNDPSSAPAPAR